MLGAVDHEVYQKLLEHLIHARVHGVIEMVSSLVEQGKDLSQFVNEFIWYLRNAMVLMTAAEAEELVDLPADAISALEEMTKDLDMDVIFRYIRILSGVVSTMKYSSNKRVDLEVALIKLCRPQMEADTNSLADRVRQLEQQLEKLLQSGIPVQQAALTGQNQAAMQSAEVKPEQDPVEQLNVKFPPAKVEELMELVDHWRDVKRNLSPQMKYRLQRATLSVNEEGTALRVLFPKEMNVESGYFLEEPERIERLKQELSRQSGRDVELEVSVMNKENDDSDMINLDCIHMDVKIED